ncbi:tyrosine-type recombinase/integrase [Poseidonibacter ostreae]|uniref:Tyrosine-type recombinase/integrase n=1 Tax=Poseidonibacter ostreae TaxID=2654171 RepID=A0A6L4WTJ1_9BACT|nr:site-specific integrase [Poseidonibacter ostreae]KAB7887605.1 tyrosine-type recombinase/integrase [Poseidonibacter ostreae]KAB7889623.1 tyrosine-type recombinase/integrase [Poseidonibacter ostreae]
MLRIKTKFTGVYFRNSQTNNKPDKTYYITYKDINNKTKELKIGKYSEGVRESYSNQKRNEIITKIRLGEEPPAIAVKKRKIKLLLNDLADKYFETRKEGKSKNSDIATCNKHLQTFFKDVDLEMVTKEHIKKLIKRLSITTTSRNIILSSKTVNNILSILISIIKFSIKEELLKNDFTVYINKNKIDNNRERFLTINEIRVLFKSVENDKDARLIFKLALNIGSRLSTLLLIKKQDIDFTHKLITLKDTKNNSSYKGFLTEEVSALLQDRVRLLKLNENIFKSNPEKRLRKILNSLFNDEIDTQDRKNKVVFHTLRHTFASHLAINGTPIYTIQKLLNHKDIKMTMRYAKLSPESGRESILNLYT